jgi:hypothetical protein
MYFTKLELITDSKLKPTICTMLSNNKNVHFNPELKYPVLNFTYIVGLFSVVPGNTPHKLWKLLLHSRFLDFRFFPDIRDESAVLTSLRALTNFP